MAVVDDELDTNQGKKTKIRGYVSCCQIAGVRLVPKLEEENGEVEHNDYKWITRQELEKEIIYPPVADQQKWVLISK